MNPISLILKIIGNLGSLAADLGDFEQAAKDLFAGKITLAEGEKLLEDLGGILGMGFITIPGVDLSQVVSTLKSGEVVAADLIAAVKDVKATGVSAVVPDLQKAVSDLEAAVSSGIVGLQNSTKEQILQVLQEISQGL